MREKNLLREKSREYLATIFDEIIIIVFPLFFIMEDDLYYLIVITQSVEKVKSRNNKLFIVLVLGNFIYHISQQDQP